MNLEEKRLLRKTIFSYLKEADVLLMSIRHFKPLQARGFLISWELDFHFLDSITIQLQIVEAFREALTLLLWHQVKVKAGVRRWADFDFAHHLFVFHRNILLEARGFLQGSFSTLWG